MTAVRRGWRRGLAILVVAAFLGINLFGARTSGRVELVIVAAKVAILALFAVAGVVTVKADHMLPVFNQGLAAPLVAAGLIFVAYEGFELIPNAVQEMRNPRTDLKRGLILAIVITSAIYVIVSLVALGNLSPDQVAARQRVCARRRGAADARRFRIRADRHRGAHVDRLGDQRDAVRRRSPRHGHGGRACAAAGVLAARAHPRCPLGVARGPLGDDLRVSAACRPDRHLVFCERGVPGDFHGRQFVGVAVCAHASASMPPCRCAVRCSRRRRLLTLLWHTWANDRTSLAWIAGFFAAAVGLETGRGVSRGGALRPRKPGRPAV